MIRGFDEISDNSQMRIYEVTQFLAIASGKEARREKIWGNLMELLKTPAEWRRYRKDLFEKANKIREKMGLKRLGS